MLNKLKRSLKTKKDPQQFLQCGIGENKFQMILLNEPNPQINSPEEKPHSLPSGFKPISASTPKRSRKSFEIIEEPPPVLTRVSPAHRLKMSQFIGEIPHKNVRMSLTSSDVVELASTSSFEKQNISKSFISNVHVKSRPRKRSASCESWDSFQKPLRHILNTITVRDLNTTEQILKLIFDCHANAKNNDNIDEAFQTFQNYIKIQALRKASETVVDWNTLKQTFLIDTSQTKENYVDRNINFALSPPPPPPPKTKCAESFKVLDTSHCSKSVITPTPINCEQKSMENHMEPTTTTVNRSVESSSLFEDSNITENNISINSILDFNFSSSTETNDDLSIFENIFNNVDPIESDDLLMFSKNFESFKEKFEESDASPFSKQKKSKKSVFRPKKTNFKRTASPYLNNETFLKLKNISKNSRSSCGSRNSQVEEDFQMSQFEQDFQQFLKTSKEQKYKVPKTQAETSTNDLEKIITKNNVKSQLSTSFTDSFETEDTLEWFEQYKREAENTHADEDIADLMSQTVDDSNFFFENIIGSS